MPITASTTFDPEMELLGYQRVVIDRACIHFVFSGCFPVDVSIELQEVGIDPVALLDWVTDHPNYKPMFQ
jgi:hypothetical protein